MAVWLHADDLGLSTGINRGIIDAIDAGFVSSVSVMANGWAFEEAVSALMARPDVRVSVHLNLLEGEPLTPADQIRDLVGEDGRLAASFGRLWGLWVRLGSKRRALLSAQVKREARAQIDRVCTILGDRPGGLGVDGHTHVHAIPFVANEVVTLAGEFGVRRVRVPIEPFHAPGGVLRLPRLGYVKHRLLRSLGSSLAAKVKHAGLSGGETAFVGVLFTGHMTPSSIEAGLKAVGCVGGKDCDAEVLLHPGGADAGEASHWAGRPELWRYYSNPARIAELSTAKDARTGELIGQARGAAGVRAIG